MGRGISFSPVNGEIREVHIDLKAMRQAIVELVVGRILFDVGVLKLEGVQFVEELEVPFPSLGHCGIVSIKRQLSKQRLPDGDRARQR